MTGHVPGTVAIRESDEHDVCAIRALYPQAFPDEDLLPVVEALLGDPAYYGRLGFLPGSAVSPPYPLPQEWQHAWQSLSLTGDQPPDGGQILLPVYWLEPALWMP